MNYAKKQWIKIDKFDPKVKEDKLVQYQNQENIVLINFKTKKNKKDYQQHYECRSDLNCHFQIKLSQKNDIVQMFSSGQHSHHKDLGSVGNLYF